MMHMRRTAERLFGKNYYWSVLGAGRSQIPLATMAASMGGNVRVGLEDSLWDAPGKLATSNAQQVQRAVSVLRSLNLEAATPDEARDMFNSKAGTRSRSDRASASPPRRSSGPPTCLQRNWSVQ